MDDEIVIKKRIDIIVAVRDEEGSISSFVAELKSITIPNIDLHIVFVEDGSKDATISVLQKLAREDKKIHYYSLDNPFRQGVALAYGISRSKADATISMDVDGSHPADTVKGMIEMYLSGADVVQAHRSTYKRKALYREFGSWVYLYLISVLVGINLVKQNVHFRLMNRRAMDIFLSNNQLFYSLRTKFKPKDYLNIQYINFVASERLIGESKFNLKYLIEIAIIWILTLINKTTFYFGLLSLLIIVGVFSYHYCWIFFPLFLLLSLYLMYSYIRINKNDYLNEVKVIETSKNFTSLS